MNKESFELLIKDKIQTLIEANLDRDPRAFALKQKNNALPPALVPTQIKYLQKSKKKIPAFYHARCIIPARAFEQSSSAKTAAMRLFQGKTCLDLTCGLGVDTYFLSQSFELVTTLEINPIYCKIAKYNFQKLGINNVTILNTSAEDFLSTYSGPNFDLIYADPSRRDKVGKRLNALAEFSPRVFDILSKLKALSSQILFKLSPLFDLSEAKKLFPEATKFSIISVDNECKELLVEVDQRKSSSGNQILGNLNVMLNRSNQVKTFVFPETMQHKPPYEFPDTLTYILEADVAFYKARANEKLFEKYFPQIRGRMNHESGFFFANSLPKNMNFPGRIYKIIEHIPYKPKLIKKRLRTLGIARLQITQRYFPFAVKEIRKQLNINDGGNLTLICTIVDRKKQTYLVEKF